MYIYIYTYIYVYIYIYIHIHVYIQIYWKRKDGWTKPLVPQLVFFCWPFKNTQNKTKARCVWFVISFHLPSFVSQSPSPLIQFY